MGILILTSIIDFIWLLSIGGIWTFETKKNPLWDSFHSLHVFVIITSVIELLIKVYFILLKKII